MLADEVREKYIKFFKAKPRNHKQISPAPLVPTEDPTTLFTSSGMQPLVPYLMGETHPEGRRLVNSQPSVRAHGKNDDVLEVGDNRHLTVFEMLGNWSLGDYFKAEQLPWFYEYLTKELQLSSNKLWVSVFEGYQQIPKDTISFDIWRKLGIPKERIYYYSEKKNWWSRSGPPQKMPTGEIGGPTSEVFYDFGKELKIHEKSRFKNQKCHPNCDCGRFLEIGNSVFMQYVKKENGELEELPQKNVDFGGGLERLTAATIDSPDLFKTDLFFDLIEKIGEYSDKKYSEEKNKSAFRIIADHVKSSVFLIVNDVVPSNKEHGYVLRRLLRRAAVKMYSLNGDLRPIMAFKRVSSETIKVYEGVYMKKRKDEDLVHQVIEDELRKFSKTLKSGLKVLEKTERVDGKVAFDLYQTYGLPLEVTVDLAQEKGQSVDVEGFKEEFGKHRELSRAASAGMFKGGLADHSEEVMRLHTVTHLLHASLRKVLGKHVQQKGSNITKDRLRFDFLHTKKLSDKEVRKVESMINEQIKKDLPVTFETKIYKEAIDEGALAFFGERYGERVKVYTIGDPSAPFSREVCGGPHVTHTSEIGRVKITKQEKIGAGLIRIYAVVD
jgi:alanyl-tRNA synthetase